MNLSASESSVRLKEGGQELVCKSNTLVASNANNLEARRREVLLRRDAIFQTYLQGGGTALSPEVSWCKAFEQRVDYYVDYISR